MDVARAAHYDEGGNTAAGGPPPAVISAGEVLATPVVLGPLRLANRLVLAPHTVNFGFADGSPDDDYVAYITRRAPGFGLTWLPIAAPDPLGCAEPGQPWLWDDRFVPGLARLVDALRACGTEPGVQLNHAGRQTSPDLIQGRTPVAPSAVTPRSIYTTVPRELTIGEIEGVVEGFAAAASRAVVAGCRAINLHFAHGYLVHQFLSPDSNQRDDEYGGSLENRMRFALAIVDAVVATVGSEVAVDVRVNGSDFLPGGNDVDDAVALGHALVAHNAHGLNVTGGVYGSSPFTLLLPFDGQEFVPLAARVRAETGAVTTAVGRIRTAEEAAAVVQSGAADLVGIGRGAIADPQWALKALGQVSSAVRPCLGTLDGCSERLRHFEAATCQVQPDVGRERRRIPRSRALRIAVVGSGPAGCEAALYAAEVHGDEVLLFEATTELGGALRLAGRTPGGQPFGDLVRFYASELARLRVAVELGASASPTALGAFRPDLVLVATGARPDVPPLDGYAEIAVSTDEEVLDGTVEMGETVVVLGAGRRAIHTALACADGGSAVTLVDHRGDRVAFDASALMRRAYKQQLASRGIAVHSGPVIRLDSGGVVLAERVLQTDLVVLSVGLRSVRDAVNVAPAGVPVAVVGDAKAPRSVMEAIAEARGAVDEVHGRVGAGEDRAGSDSG